jgi:hypothetical protein
VYVFALFRACCVASLIAQGSDANEQRVRAREGTVGEPMEQEPRRVSIVIKAALAVGLVVFVIAQGKILVGPGGILEKWGFWGGFRSFGEVSFRDPITAAGFVDTVTLILGFLLILANGIPRGRLYWPVLIVSIIVLIVYPGLAVLGFLLLCWRRYGQFRP